MGILATLLIGLIVGAIAKLLMPGRDPGGIFITMLLGVGGALLAKYMGMAVGWYQEGQPAGFLASVLGAILVLGLYRIARSRRHRTI